MADQHLYSNNLSNQSAPSTIPGSESAANTDEGAFEVESNPSAGSDSRLLSSRSANYNAAKGTVAASTTASSAELSRLKVKLSSALGKYPDFPTKGVLFEDIMPLFASPQLHGDLIQALQLLISNFTTQLGDKAKTIDVIVGLESRGFLFAPTLALQIGAAFVPVRKKGKLPGECETESFQKEYGADHFQMQKGSIKPGQKVLILDDIIATGGSASAAGKLVTKMGGELLAYIFMMELDFLKGKEKLDAPVLTLFAGQENALTS